MEKENNKLKFTIIWSSCLFVLLLLVGFGVSSSKGTRASETLYTCDGGTTTQTSALCTETLNFSFDTNRSNVCSWKLGSEWSGDCEVLSVDEDDDGERDYYSYNCKCSKAATLVSGSQFEDGDGYHCYYCLFGNKYMVSTSLPDSGCVSGWTVAFMSKCAASGDSSSEPEETCPSGQIMTEDGCVQQGQCYECNGQSGLFHWGTGTTGAPSCGGGWHLRTDLNQSQCVSTSSGDSSSEPEETCPSGQIMTEDGCVQQSQCYECNGQSGLFHWGTGTTGAPSCGGGWHLRTDLNQSQCKTSTIKNVTITFNANNGSGGGSETCSYDISSGDDNCSVTAPTVSRSGYTFKGWGTSSTCVSGWTGSKLVSSNETYYACWVSDGTDEPENPNPGTTPGTDGSDTGTTVPDSGKSSTKSASIPSTV